MYCMFSGENFGPWGRPLEAPPVKDAFPPLRVAKFIFLCWDFSAPGKNNHRQACSLSCFQHPEPLRNHLVKSVPPTR